MTAKETSAFIAIVGKANAGKSSLLNALLMQKVAIVSPKPQTTRTRIMGIHTEGDVQLVFVDTPGIHIPKNSLGESMVKAIYDGMSGVEGCIMVIDVNRQIEQDGNIHIGKADMELIERLKKSQTRTVLAINKIDLLKDKQYILKVIKAYTDAFQFDEIFPCSAKTGYNINELRTALLSFAVPSPHMFDDDALTDQTERFLAAEMVREKLLYSLDKEIPHGIAVSTEKFKHRDDILDIETVIYCERASHKGIIIGKGGEMLKIVASRARADMENMFDCKVNLQVWVKVEEDWRNKPGLIKNFGLDNK